MFLRLFKLNKRYLSNLTIKNEKYTLNNLDTLSTSTTSTSTTTKLTLLQKGQIIQGKIDYCIENIGYVTIIENNTTTGIIDLNEARYWSQLKGRNLKYGDIIQGYVGKVDTDGKVTILCRPPRNDRLLTIKNQLLELLNTSETKSLSLGDHSPPEKIAEYLPAVSKSDFKKAVGILLKSNLISLSPNSITLLNENERKTQVINPYKVTVYIGNIHPDLKDPSILKTFVNNILNQSFITSHPKHGLTIHRQNTSEPSQVNSYLEVEQVRLKPLEPTNVVIDGQTVGHQPHHDKYRPRDGRVGFLDIVLKNPPVIQTNNQNQDNKSHNSDDKEQFNFLKLIENLSIQLLNRQIFQGKKIKVSQQIKKETK